MKNIAKKINELHNGLVKNTVETAIEIGRLLTKQKEKVRHGAWEDWMEENLEFSDSTAKRYVRCFKEREEIKSVNLTDLNEVYNWFNKREDRRDYLGEQDKERAKRRLKFANRKHKYRNPPKGKYENQIICGDTLDVMRTMTKTMSNSIHLICTSIPYNNGLFYGPNCKDSKPYQEYLDWIGEFISLCYCLLVRGGRLIINCDNMTNKEREQDGEFTYKHALDCDIRYKVRELGLGLLEYQDIIWYKYNNGGAKIKCWGSHCSPSKPNLRNCKEHFIIWAKEDYTLPNPENVEPDLAKKEFERWTYNVWEVHPNTRKNCPHPCTWPISITDRCVKLFSFPNQIVMDPFCGSGSTCVSANNLNRKWIGIDQNPNYCQWARDRIDGKDMDKIFKDFLKSIEPHKKKKTRKLVVSKLKKNTTFKKSA